MTRRAFDPTWQGDRTLQESAILANTAGERHDAAVTVCDQEQRGATRHNTLDVLQALGLMPYDDRPALPPSRIAEVRGPQAKLSPRDILAMQVRRDNGVSVKAIAREYAVAHSTVSRLTVRRAS